MAIDYEQSKVLLNNSYEKAAQELPAAVTQYITDNKDALDTIFSSKTQSYREVLLGCAVARYQDRSCNIRHLSLIHISPAAGHGNARYPVPLPQWDAVHHSAFRPPALLCEAEDGDK